MSSFQAAGSWYMSRLVLTKWLERPALDQVAGHGERRAGEADERDAPGELAADQPDRVEDERHRLAADRGRAARRCRARTGWARATSCGPAI